LPPKTWVVLGAAADAEGVVDPGHCLVRPLAACRYDAVAEVAAVLTAGVAGAAGQGQGWRVWSRRVGGTRPSHPASCRLPGTLAAAWKPATHTETHQQCQPTSHHPQPPHHIRHPRCKGKTATLQCGWRSMAPTRVTKPIHTKHVHHQCHRIDQLHSPCLQHPTSLTAHNTCTIYFVALFYII